MSVNVFISHHANTCLPMVKKIADLLEREGIKCWYAPRDVRESAFEEIANAIEESNVLIPLLNIPAAKSKYVQKEILYATDYANNGGDILILPVILNEDIFDNKEIKFLLMGCQFIKANDGLTDTVLDEILKKTHQKVGPITQKEEAEEPVAQETNQEESKEPVTPETNQEESREPVTPETNQEDGKSLYDLGMDAFNKHEYECAFSLFKQAAASGDVEARCNLGFCYEHGFGVEANEFRAFYNYLKSACEGSIMGMRNTAFGYYNGMGIKQNFDKAAHWFEKAALHGEIVCMNALGCLYENGTGVNQSYTEAGKWYMKAAKAGDSLAMHNLGCLYFNGKGMEKNYEAAADWFEASANMGNARAMRNLALCLEEGLGVKQNPSLAKLWRKRAERA